MTGARPGGAAGLLYGGIPEELLVRWGLLTGILWLGWRFLQRGVGPPRPWLGWGAVILSALVFGAAHLPAAAMTLTLTPALAARLVLLNALAGGAFGWLYWRRSLEAAMIAHAAAHVVFAIAHFASALADS